MSSGGPWDEQKKQRLPTPQDGSVQQGYDI